MSPNQQQQISALASTALGYEDEARTRFLDHACADNPTLRFAVETLITRRQQDEPEKHAANTLPAVRRGFFSGTGKARVIWSRRSRNL